MGLAGAARPARGLGLGQRRRTCWSGRWRTRGGGAAVLAESMDQPHLIDGPGPGHPRAGRADHGRGGSTGWPRSCHPGIGRVTASFAGVAKHYGVSVAICPPRRGNRKGVVEKANHTAAQRWWRTLADDVTARAGPALAGPVVRPARRRPACAPTADGKATVADHRRRRAAAPGAAGAVPGRSCRSTRTVVARRRWWPSAATATRSPPELARGHGHRRRTGSAPATSTSPPPPGSWSPATAWPRPAPGSRSATTATSSPWNSAAMAASTTGRAAPPQATHPTRPRRPRRRRDALRARPASRRTPPATPSIDLARYAAAAHGRNTLHMTTHHPTTGEPMPAPTPPPHDRARAGQPLPAAARPPGRAEAATPPPKPCPPSSTHASRRGPVADRRPGAAAARSRSTPPRPAASPAGCGSPACPPPPPWRTSTTTPNPASTAHLIDELGHLPLPRDRHQRAADRTARRRQDPPRRRPGPQGRRSRLPHLLHHRRRPRRPLPPRRDRRPLGHHHALLRRTHPARHRRTGLPPAARRSRLRAVPGRLPALPEDLDRADHQPRRRRPGARSSATPPSPPPCSTGSCTAPSCSTSTATPTASATTTPAPTPLRRTTTGTRQPLR